MNKETLEKANELAKSERILKDQISRLESFHPFKEMYIGKTGAAGNYHVSEDEAIEIITRLKGVLEIKLYNVQQEFKEL